MEEIIRYFNEECIKKFIDLRIDLYKSPEDLAGFITATRKETDEIARRFVETVIQEMNDVIKDMTIRKNHWYVEHKYDDKKLITSVGDIELKKTLYVSKDEVNEDGKPLSCYLIDKVLGLLPNQSMTDDAVANILEETVQTSYKKGGKVASPNGVTKGAVKNVIHGLKFPANYKKPDKKKEVEYLYIEADEDHYNLQFQNKKGDLKYSDNGRKLNGAINKIVYVHEGIVPEAPQSKRYKLVNPHYFCRGDEQDNRTFWQEIFNYIEDTYDVENVKRIYMNSDGGNWIKTGYRGIMNVTFVLDEYHIKKYITKLTSHMKDSADDAKQELYKCIRSETKADFYNIVNRLKNCTDDEDVLKRIEDAANFIDANWSAAKYRLKKEKGIVGSSTEGHVYHVLSKRMSTNPMGWSRHGASQMAHLLEYYWNGGDMLELAKYQRETLPMAAGAEEVVLSANTKFRAVKSYRTQQQKEYGKYSDSISATLSLEKRKQLWFHLNGKIKDINDERY